MKAHRIDAGHHVVAQVRGLEAARLQCADEGLDACVDLDEPRGRVRSLPEAYRERLVAEAVHLLQKRAVGAAGKARPLLVDDAEGQELGGLELRGKLRLALAGAISGQVARHADHFEAPVPEVVSLLRVQGQYPVGERLVGRYQRRDLFHAEHLGRGEPMPAIRRPQPPVVAPHHDQGIEECGGLVDLRGEPLGVRRGQVALKRSRLHRIERQAREQQGASAEGLLIGADDGAARRAHQRREIRDVLAVERDGNLRGLESARFLPRREPTAAAGARRAAPRACAGGPRAC